MSRARTSLVEALKSGSVSGGFWIWPAAAVVDSVFDDKTAADACAEFGRAVFWTVVGTEVAVVVVVIVIELG